MGDKKHTYRYTDLSVTVTRSMIYDCHIEKTLKHDLFNIQPKWTSSMQLPTRLTISFNMTVLARYVLMYYNILYQNIVSNVTKYIPE